MTIRPVDTGRYVHDLDFLSDVTRETLSSLQLGPLLRRVVSLMRDRFGYDYAAVALLEEDTVKFRAGSGGELDQVFESDSGQVWKVPVGKGIVGTAVSQAGPRLSNDVTSDPDYIMVDFLSKTRSELCVPLIHRDEVMGVLDVQSNRPGAFDETDVRLLEIVGALVAPVIHSAALHERWRRRMRYLHLIGEMSHMVMTSLTQENVIKVACEVILEALDVAYVGIGLLSSDGGRLVHSGHSASVEAGRGRHRLDAAVGEGLAGRVVATGRSVNIGDPSDVGGGRWLAPGMRSAVCVPLRMRDQVMGVLQVEHGDPEQFTEEDQRQLEHLAAFLAQALENAQLFDAQRRRWQQLLVINEAARIATEPLDLDEIVVQVAREVHDRFGYFAVAVMLCEEREVVLRALRCEEELELGVGHRERMGCGVAGQVAASGQVLSLGTADAIPRGSALRSDIQSVLCVPLRSQAAVIGVIEVQGLGPHAFGEDDRLVMETLAKSVAGAIANARAIQQTEQMREDLNRMIVHDLRNPVQAVLFTLQEVQRAAEDTLGDRVTGAVDEGIRCAEDILGMVNSLLDLARFEAGQARLRLVPAVLNDHVRLAASKAAPIARSKGIALTTELSPDVPVIRMDHELVNRTLSNLIGNALKFTPNGAQVAIRTEPVTDDIPERGVSAPAVLVSVTDTGEGIPEAYRDKIFEKFGQVETRKAGLKMSTGLGLALCRYVVEAHGGCIWVESEPGTGATFFFTLPPNRG